MTTPSFIPCHSERWSRRSRRILKSAVWRILQNYFHGEKVLPRLRSNRKSNARKGTQIAWGKTYLVSNLTLYRKFIHELWKSVYDHAPLKSSTMIMIKYPTLNVLISNSNIFISAFVINVTPDHTETPKRLFNIYLYNLFSAESNSPFFAGFGNKSNDVTAYRAVGVPLARIFTVNHRGEICHELLKNYRTSWVWGVLV